MHRDPFMDFINMLGIIGGIVLVVAAVALAIAKP